MTKFIKFRPLTDRTKDIEDSPKPSNLFTPSWFSKAPKYNSPATQLSSVVDFAKNRDTAHMTYKMCVPFLDAMTSGYMVTLPATVVVTQVETDEGVVPRIQWQVSWSIADMLEPFTIPHFPVPAGHHRTAFRWITNWSIETPAGYSAFITHPVHRFDLPFQTLTGFVDTDKHPNPLLFPFFIKEGFEGEIPAGTPIAQVFPIKRDSWESKKIDETLPYYYADIVKKPFEKAYRKMFWTKKQYR